MQKILVYWRDIPSQVIFKSGRKRGKAALSARFQEGIDRAAMRAGKGGSEDYLADWRRETVTQSGKALDVQELQTLARDEARVLEAQYSDQQLAVLVKNNGQAEG
jgi:hypothetical protein